MGAAVMSRFAVGDRVVDRMQSAPRRMTVKAVRETVADAQVTCTWIGPDNVRREKVFAASDLAKVPSRG